MPNSAMARAEGTSPVCSLLQVAGQVSSRGSQERGKAGRYMGPATKWWPRRKVEFMVVPVCGSWGRQCGR